MVRYNFIEFERFWVKVGAVKGLYMAEMLVPGVNLAFIIHMDDDCANFEQSVGLWIEASGFQVDNDRQKSSETIYNGCIIGF